MSKPIVKAAKPAKPVKPKKIDKATLFLLMTRIINGKVEPSDQFPEFPVKFYVLEPSAGVRDITHMTGDRVVSYCHEDMATNTILQYCQSSLRKQPGFNEWTVKEARDCMEFWRSVTRAIPKPPATAFKSDKGLAFHRLQFDPMWNDKGCPLFDEFVKRTSNGMALKAFIGSLFDDRADRQQYLWLYGQGMNGKGSIIRLLRQILGPSFGAEDASQAKSQFWTAGLLGKRLIVFPDCNSYSFPASQRFKSLTGGDPVRVERKNRDPHIDDLSCKFMFASNEKPSLSSQQSDRRRAIYCEVDPIPVPADPRYDEALWGEAPWVLGKCLGVYQSLCSNGGMIPAECSELDLVIEENETRYDTLFAKYFVKGLDELRDLESKNVWDKSLFLLDPRDLETVVQKLRLDRSEKRYFIKYLESRHGVRYKNVRVNGVVLKKYAGIKLSTPGETLARGWNVYQNL